MISQLTRNRLVDLDSMHLLRITRPHVLLADDITAEADGHGWNFRVAENVPGQLFLSSYDDVVFIESTLVIRESKLVFILMAVQGHQPYVKLGTKSVARFLAVRPGVTKGNPGYC